MDRMTQEALRLPEMPAECGLVPAEVAAELAQAQPLPTPHERLARIVRTIEAEIIPRLVRAHRPPGAELLPAETLAAGSEHVDEFVQLVLAQDDAAWQTFLDGLVGRGMPVEEIYLGVMGPAARELGRMWEEDECSWTDVTVGVGRMQRSMRALSPAFGHEVAHPADGRRVLLLPAPGEQHTFGLSIVAEFFRRAGWEVVGDSEAKAADPAALVRSEWFDVIGISVGYEARLDWLRSGIEAIRKASRNRAIGVMVGGPVLVADPSRAQAVGADATAIDGRQAPAVAEDLLERRLMRV
jgi:MerR family transcriptional regulator, light-induced transcriptional regulator